MSALDKYGAILHAEWKKGLNKDTIIGYWGEDMSPYEMKIPGQLRDILIELQHSLCDRYTEIEDARAKLRLLEGNASKIVERK